MAFHSLGKKSNLNVNTDIQVLMCGNRQYLTPFSSAIRSGKWPGRLARVLQAWVLAVADGSQKKHNILLLLAWIYCCHGDCIIQPASWWSREVWPGSVEMDRWPRGRVWHGVQGACIHTWGLFRSPFLFLGWRQTCIILLANSYILDAYRPLK